MLDATWYRCEIRFTLEAHMKPKHSEPRYTLDLSTAQVVMLAQAMEVYSNKSYGSADDYNP